MLRALTLRGFSQGLLENFLLGVARILDSRTVLKIYYRSYLVYFHTEKTMGSGPGLESFAKEAGKVEDLGRTGDFLSLSCSISAREIARGYTGTNGTTDT